MSRPGFMVYFDWQHILRALSDDQRGKLVLAMVDYAEKAQKQTKLKIFTLRRWMQVGLMLPLLFAS